MDHQTDEVMSIPSMNHQTDEAESQCINIKGLLRYYCRIPRRCLFIQGLVITNSLTELVVVSILINYLTEARNEKLIHAAATVNILEFLSGILSVPASILKDYLGCHPMVFLTTQVYIMGMVFLCISASIRSTLDVPIENSSYMFENLLLYVGLYLIALGKAGSNSSCVEEFFGEQLKNNASNNDIDEKRNRARQMFWMRASQLLGQILGTVLLTVVDVWKAGYVFCTIMMQFALIVFLIRFRLKCLGRAATTTYTPPPPPPPPNDVDEQEMERLPRNDEVEAATITDDTPPPPPNDVDEQEREILQRNNEVEAATTTDTPNPTPPPPNDVEDYERENMKILILLVPISVTFLIYGIVKAIGSTFFLEQGNNMKDNQNSEILLNIVSSFSKTLHKISIKRILRNRLTGVRNIYATLIIIGVGLIFSIICCATAQAVEAKRLGIVVEHGLQDITGDKDGDPVIPMSVFWLLPQFIFLGAMKGLVEDGMESFFESELPMCMKRYASEVTQAVTEIGTLLSVVLVSITAKASTIGGGSSWFANTVNKSHLDRFYRSLTILCLIFCMVYAYVSTSYIRKRLPRNEEEDSEEIAQPELNLLEI